MTISANQATELLESIGDAFYGLDADWRFIYLNPKAEQLLGMKQEALIGRIIWEVFPHMVYSQYYPEMHRAVDEHKTVQFETFSVVLDGWVEVEVYPTRAGLSIYVHDISERKQAQEQLSRLAAIVTSSNDAIISKTLDGIITSWNPGAEQIFGYTADEVIGESIIILFPPERFWEEIDFLKKMAANEKVMGYDTVRLKKDGSEVYVSVSLSPLKDWQGNIIGVTKIAQNITERKRTETALKRYAQRMEILHEIDNGIINATSIRAVVETTLKHIRQLIPCQRASVGLFDWTTEEWLVFADDSDRPYSLGREIRIPIPAGWDEGFGRENIRIQHDLRLVQPQMPIYEAFIKDGLVSGMQALLEVQGQRMGFLGLNAETPNFFTAEHQEIASQVASQIAVAIKQMQLSEEVAHYTSELERHIAELIQAKAELHDVNDHLEARVQERTSELNQLNKTLRTNEENLQTIFNLLPVGASLLNADRKIIQMNRSLEKILDLSVDELLQGKYKLRNYIHPDGTPVQASEFPSERVYSEQQPVLDVEMGIVKEDGETIWTSVSAALLPSNQGVVTVTVNLTRRKQAEAALRQSEKHLRLLAENSPDVIYIMDLTQQRASYLNRPEFLGYSQSDLETSGSLIRAIHPEDKERVLAHWQEVMMAPQLKDVGPVEYRLQDKQGKWQWIQSREGIFASAVGGKPSQILVTLTVITDHKQAEQQARELEQERQQVKMLSDFIKNTSHDFRTPLSIISSSLYLLSKSIDPEKQKRYIGNAENQIAHLTLLIERLQEMGRLDSLVTLVLQPLDVNPLLSDLCAKLNFKAREKAVTVVCSLWESKLMVQGDYQELSLAFAELGKNALAYTLSNGTITIGTRQEENKAVIEVCDTGIGIPIVDLPHIFERLYRVDKARSSETGGTGLGLSMAKRVIDLHEGILVVESTPGEGSMFRIVLPLSP